MTGQRKLPVKMNISAIVTVIMIRMTRKGVSHWLAWIVAAIMAFGLVLNLITPSKGERAIWAPTLAILLICSLIVAFAKVPAAFAG